MIAAITLAQTDNRLTMTERREGWKLLFDGRSTDGWHSFKSDKAGSGWVVADGTLRIEDLGHAGDLLTNEKFDWFELKVDFCFMQPGQNSGIMFRVADTGEATWHSGPEIQIYDHPFQEGVETTGFLYQLYRAQRNDSKPAGEWNSFVIRIAKDKSFVKLNGSTQFEFVYGSQDFWNRVAKSKFAEFPQFGKLEKGSIAIQGDHGHVMFKNIKIKQL